MKISHRGLYALKALLNLAAAHERGLVKIHVIAEEEDIPEKFLEGILVTLKNARLVASERGREGGYRLRRPPGEIQVGEVVRLMDGPLAPLGDAVELADRVRNGAPASPASSTCSWTCATRPPPSSTTPPWPTSCERDRRLETAPGRPQGRPRLIRPS